MRSGITILGLGPGSADLLTRRAWRILSEAEEVYLRTGWHPAVDDLRETLDVHTFDGLYQDSDDFEEVYTGIVSKVLDLGTRPGGVLYAVPGDPMVGEATSKLLLIEAKRLDLPVEIVPGVSFIEPCLSLLGYDALDGLFISDALELAGRHHPSFPPDSPALIAQVYSAMVAADLKLVLMNQYPDSHPVTLIHAAGSDDAHVEQLPLHQMDRSGNIASLTALFVPPLPEISSFESFQETVAHLRSPEGCPWDREQTHMSLRKNLLGETYEALHALDMEDHTGLKEEMGDLLLQIVLHAQIALEAGEFSMADVIASIQEKIVRRHPHVFAELPVEDVGQVLHNWEALKASERDVKGRGESALDGVPETLPALAQSYELQARAARLGFDWPEIEGVLEKVVEELRELAQAVRDIEQEDEFGDLLMAVVNYGRWLGIDPEDAVRRACGRFRHRFGYVERAAAAAGKKLDEMSLSEMEALWQEAKGRRTAT